MSTLTALVVPLLAHLASPKPMPDPEDVKAGWLGFAVFLALGAVVVFLGFSLRKHLGKVDFEERDGSARHPESSTGAERSAAEPEAAEPEDAPSAQAQAAQAPSVQAQPTKPQPTKPQPTKAQPTNGDAPAR